MGMTNQPHWNARTQTMSREALDALHLARIRALIAYAYEHSPLHRRLYDQTNLKPADVRTWDDFFVKVPFTDKPDYLAAQGGSRFAGLALPENRLSAYFHTTGTTGTFLHEVYSEYDVLRMGSIYCYAWWDHGVRPGDSMFICHNFGCWLGLWHMYWGARLFGLTVYPGGGMSSDERIDAILEHQVTMVAGTPTYLLHLARRAKERSIDLAASPIRFLCAGGEPGLAIPVTRAALERRWGAVGVDAYGMSEVGLAHMSCHAHPGGVHVMEDAFHAYAADPDSGLPVPDGEEGENVVTSFAHYAQPFIKYRSHDIVRRYATHDHGCGWTWAFLEGSVLGRTDFMVVIRGVNVYAAAVENLLGEIEGLTHYYELHISRVQDMDRLLVKVECEPWLGTSDLPALATRLADIYRFRLGVTLETEVVPASSLPRYELKTTRLFDHRPPELRTPFRVGRGPLAPIGPNGESER